MLTNRQPIHDHLKDVLPNICSGNFLAGIEPLDRPTQRADNDKAGD